MLIPHDHHPRSLTQGTVLEIMRATYERGGLLAFFSGNDAGILYPLCASDVESLAAALV